MSITTIRAGLKTVISNLITSTQVAVVYDYYEPNVSGYPAVIFDITDNTDAFLTNNENMIKIVFTAFIIVEIISKQLDSATSILDSVTDALITELRKQSNMSLGGSVDWVSPVVGPRSQIETPNGNAYAQQLNITVNVSASVN